MSERQQQDRAVQRRAQILAATEELLLRGGSREVTHRAVAAAAGVPVATIRYYFQTREGLLWSCLEAIEVRREQAAEDALREAESLSAPSTEQLARLVMRVWYGADLDDASLAGTVGWLVDCRREGEVLSQRLIELRATIDAQLRRLLDGAGLSGLPEQLVAAVADGSVVSSAAEGRGEIGDRAVSHLVWLLQPYR